MTNGVSPIVRGRRLAMSLRQLRTASGKTVEEAAIHLECSAAKISRIENGLVGVRVQDARDLLDLYGVVGQQRESFLELVRQSRAHGWWHPYTDVMSEEFDRLVGFEDEATSMLMLESRLVPGLLQTGDYAVEVIASRHDTPVETIERRVRLRMARQQVLVRPQPASLHLLLDEAVLRRQIGSARLMANQCRRLIDDAGKPNVTLQIIPFTAGTYQAPGFSFTIFVFGDPADPKMVYEELVEGSSLRESAEITGRYMAAFEHAMTHALAEAESITLLNRIAEAYDAQ
jgi:transcriptional regulator with XRE-family HTH domain